MRNNKKFIWIVSAVLLSSVLLLVGGMLAINARSEPPKPYDPKKVSTDTADVGAKFVTPIPQDEMQEKFYAMYEISGDGKSISVVSADYLEKQADAQKGYLLDAEVFFLVQDSIRVYRTYEKVILEATDGYEKRVIETLPLDDLPNYLQMKNDIYDIILYRMRVLSDTKHFADWRGFSYSAGFPLTLSMGKGPTTWFSFDNENGAYISYTHPGEGYNFQTDYVFPTKEMVAVPDGWTDYMYYNVQRLGCRTIEEYERKVACGEIDPEALKKVDCDTPAQYLSAYRDLVSSTVLSNGAKIETGMTCDKLLKVLSKAELRTVVLPETETITMDTGSYERNEYRVVTAYDGGFYLSFRVHFDHTAPNGSVLSISKTAGLGTKDAFFYGDGYAIVDGKTISYDMSLKEIRKVLDSLGDFLCEFTNASRADVMEIQLNDGCVLEIEFWADRYNENGELLPGSIHVYAGDLGLSDKPDRWDEAWKKYDKWASKTNGQTVPEDPASTEEIPLVDGVPTVLPDGGEYRVAYRVGLENSELYTISGQCTKAGTVRWDADGVNGKGLALGSVLRSDGTYGQMYESVKPKDADKIERCSGILYWVDFSNVLFSSPDKSSLVRISVEFSGSKYGQEALLRFPVAYYLTDGKWVMAETSNHDIELPNQYKGWIYVPAAPHDTTAYSEWMSDENGNFTNVTVNNLLLEALGHDPTKPSEVVFDEILFIWEK